MEKSIVPSILMGVVWKEVFQENIRGDYRIIVPGTGTI